MQPAKRLKLTPDQELRADSRSVSTHYSRHSITVMNAYDRQSTRCIQLSYDLTGPQISLLKQAIFLISKHSRRMDHAYHEASYKNNQTKNPSAPIAYRKINLALLKDREGLIQKEIQAIAEGLKITSNAIGYNGGCSTIYFICHEALHLNVVLKQSVDERSRFDLQQEVGILSELKHDNVISLLGCDTDAKYQIREFPNFILLPAADCDSYQFFIKNPPEEGIFFKETMRYIDQVLQALNYLLGKSIVLCDLKEENVLLFKSSHRWVVCDFGYARKMKYPKGDNISVDCQGTPYTMAPEREYRQNYNKGTDIFSLGRMIMNIGFKVLDETQQAKWHKQNLYGIRYFTEHPGIKRAIRIAYSNFSDNPFQMIPALDEMRQWSSSHLEAAKTMYLSLNASDFSSQDKLSCLWMPCILAILNNKYQDRPDISELMSFMNNLKIHMAESDQLTSQR